MGGIPALPSYLSYMSKGLQSSRLPSLVFHTRTVYNAGKEIEKVECFLSGIVR